MYIIIPSTPSHNGSITENMYHIQILVFPIIIITIINLCPSWPSKLTEYLISTVMLNNHISALLIECNKAANDCQHDHCLFYINYSNTRLKAVVCGKSDGSAPWDVLG